MGRRDAVAASADSARAVDPVAPFQQTYDLFGDGSIQAIPLEGHFCGQMGLRLETEVGVVLLAADACWLRESFEQLILPHPMAMAIMYDRGRYLGDLKALQGFQRLHPEARIIPSHCTRSIDAYQLNLQAAS